MNNLNNLQSLILYSFVFLISIILANIYQEKYFNENIIKGSIDNNYSTKINKKQNSFIAQNIWLILIISLPVILSSTRFGIGTDYFTYTYLYDANKNRTIADILLNDEERLFTIIYPISRILFKDVWGVFFISSFITMFFIIKTLNYYGKKISIGLSLFIYFCLLYGISYNAVRQIMAAAIVFYAYHYILEEKPLKYCLLVILSAQIHNSTYVCLLFYLLKYTKGKKYTIKRICFYIIIIFSPILIFIFLNILKSFKISRFSSINFDFTNFGVGFLIYLLPVIVPVLLCRKSLLKENPKYDLFINILLLEIPLQYLGYFNLHAYRVVYYASIIEVILIPLIINSVTNQRNKIILNTYFIVWYIFKFVFDFYINGGAEIFPYSSIL